MGKKTSDAFFTTVDGQGPSVGSGELHIRCPNCHNSIDVVADAALTDISCDSCGTHFSLARENVETCSTTSIKTFGRFELVERVGIGSFGTVWKARDTELDRTVAVKIPRKGELDAHETEKFLREARAVAQLQHPNIVTVHEVGRQDGTIYMVSDFVRGATLADWLLERQPTMREAAQLCAKIADALHHAHESGVVHRDLKPSNIMLDLAGEPHVLDFGLAKRDVAEVTMTVEGRVLGTPAYMPPEQARGEGHHADRRSDIYSLGVILFELLTGELPFRGNARMLMVQILTEQPPHPRKLNGNVPRDLETICLKCLEKEPNRRYQTAAELAEDLNRYLSGRPVLARPVGAIGRLWRWYRCNPDATARVAGSYATALSIVFLFWALEGLLLYGFGIDPAEDAGKGIVEIIVITVCLYLPMLWSGVRVLNGDARFLWMSLATLAVGASLPIFGLFRVLTFAGVLGKLDLSIPLFVLLADLLCLGVLVHVIALICRHVKSDL